MPAIAPARAYVEGECARTPGGASILVAAAPGRKRPGGPDRSDPCRGCPGRSGLAPPHAAADRHRGWAPWPAGLRPIFREATFLRGGVGGDAVDCGPGWTRSGQATGDPFLFRHLARHLDGPMLAAAARAAGTGAPLDPAASVGLHLNLTVAGVPVRLFCPVRGRRARRAPPARHRDIHPGGLRRRGPLRRGTPRGRPPGHVRGARRRIPPRADPGSPRRHSAATS